MYDSGSLSVRGSCLFQVKVPFKYAWLIDRREKLEGRQDVSLFSSFLLLYVLKKKTLEIPGLQDMSYVNVDLFFYPCRGYVWGLWFVLVAAREIAWGQQLNQNLCSYN